MKFQTHRRPASARTTFRFTREELIEALKSYVEASGQTVPPGKAGVWVDEERSHQTGKPATLFIDN